jgi:hypothetical protein
LKKRVERFIILMNVEGKPVLAYAPKGLESRGDSAFGSPEPILAAFEVCDKLTLLNANGRLEVQAPDDCCKIETMYLAELSRAQPMIAVVSSPVVPGAKRHG